MSPNAEEPISPELVLVDPVLRERVLRESLQELLLAGSEPPAPRPLRAPPAPLLPEAPEALVVAPLSRPRRRRVRGSSLATATVVALLLALPSLAFLPPRQEPLLGKKPAVATTGDGTIVTWQAQPTADYYVFELSQDGRLVQLETVVEPAATVRPDLPAGAYDWQVLAGDGPLSRHDTHGPIAGGTVALR